MFVGDTARLLLEPTVRALVFRNALEYRRPPNEGIIYVLAPQRLSVPGVHASIALADTGAALYLAAWRAAQRVVIPEP